MDLDILHVEGLKASYHGIRHTKCSGTGGSISRMWKYCR
jgi:hypothetical protein